MMYRVRARRSESDGHTYWQIEQLMGPRWIAAFDYNEEGYKSACELIDIWNFEVREQEKSGKCQSNAK